MRPLCYNMEQRRRRRGGQPTSNPKGGHLLLTNFRNSMRPYSAPDGKRTSAADGCVTADVTVQLGAEHIGGVLFLPGQAGRWPLVICSHGLTATHENLTETCRQLTELGVAALAFDFRNSNGPRSSGGISTMSVVPTASTCSTRRPASRRSPFSRQA